MRFNLPLLPRIILAIVFGVLLGGVMPDWFIRVFNTFNSIFDQLLKFLIPLIIVGLVAPAIADVGSRAGKMLVITTGLAYFATVLSGIFGYFCSSTIFPMISELNNDMTNAQTREFLPYFTIEIKPILEVMPALVFSFMAGLGVASIRATALKAIFDEFQKIITKTISTVIIPLLPIFIFGLFQNMAATGQVAPVLSSFIKVIALIFVFTFTLLILQYCVAGAISGRNPFRMLYNMFPAYFTALGTSSSAATIPVTLAQVKKNGIDEKVAGFVVPLCATIHLSGSTLKIVSTAVMLMLMNGMQFDFMLFLGFILMLGITMVAAPGVPGGAIMASLGVLGSVLGFNDELQGMMITLYVAMDSFGTACNVTGDGAIAAIVDKIARKNSLA